MIHALSRALVLVLLISSSPLSVSAVVEFSAPGPCAAMVSAAGCTTSQSSDHSWSQFDGCEFSQGQSSFADDADDEESSTIPVRVALNGSADHWLANAGSIVPLSHVAVETIQSGPLYQTLCRYRC